MDQGCIGCLHYNETRDHYLNDPLLKNIAEMLGNEWSTLGVYLSVKPATMHKLRSNVTIDVKMWPKHMLEVWVQRHRGVSKMRYRDLLQALEKIHRRDLVEEVRIRYNYDAPENAGLLDNNDNNLTLMLFDFLASHLAAKWRDLGIYLHVPSSELDRIEAMFSRPPSNQDTARELLSAWRSEARQESEYQRIERLKIALKAIHRNDIVGMIEKDINKSINSCRNVFFRSQHPPAYSGNEYNPQQNAQMPTDGRFHEHPSERGVPPPPYDSHMGRSYHSQPMSSPGIHMDCTDNSSFSPQGGLPSYTDPPTQSHFVQQATPSQNQVRFSVNASNIRGANVHPTPNFPHQPVLRPGHFVSNSTHPPGPPDTRISAVGDESLRAGGQVPSIASGEEVFLDSQGAVSIQSNRGILPEETEHVRRGVERMGIEENTMSDDMTLDQRLNSNGSVSFPQL